MILKQNHKDSSLLFYREDFTSRIWPSFRRRLNLHQIRLDYTGSDWTGSDWINSRQGSWFTVDVLVPSAFDRRGWCFIAEGSSSSETSSRQDGNFSKAQTHWCFKNSHWQVPHRNQKWHLTDDGWSRRVFFLHLGWCWRGRLTLPGTQSLAVVYTACERYTAAESELFKWFPALIITSWFFFFLNWTSN